MRPGEARLTRDTEGASPPPPGASAAAPPLEGVQVRVGHFRPGGAELRELIDLAVPVAVAQVGMMFMGVVDSIMVGRVSPRDLAAVSLGNVYFFASVVFGMGVLFALDPVVSQALGARDDEGVARGTQRGLLLALGLTVVATLLLCTAEPVLRALRQPAEVVPVAAGYAWASIAGVLPFYLYIVQRQVMQAMGRLRPVLLAMLVANIANVGFNWVLIFGNWGFPPLGAVGAGWASSGSRWVMALSIAIFAWPALKPQLRPFRREVLRAEPLLGMLRIGGPTGMQLQLEFGAFAVAGLAMGLLGTVAVAGHQVALNLASLTFMVPVGVAQATAVLVGRAVGREDPWGARRASGAGLVVGAAFMTITATAFLLIPGPLARIYSPDAAVIALGASLLPIAGLFQVADGVQVVAAAALRGIGDTRAPMLINLLGFWGIGLPVGVWLAFGADLGPRGVWWGLAVGLLAVALLLLQRVRVRFGRDLRRLVFEAG
ncbi:MAG: MATE family efflux transporter [Gemmatimonadetes bacterium]|nr:MATE family efflux transporter [Gemmatimonadota bacterium]